MFRLFRKFRAWSIFSKFRTSPALLLLTLLSLPFSSCKSDPPAVSRAHWDPTPSFWIWNQTTPPPSGNHRLYVQIAEFTADSHRTLQPVPSSPDDIAVIRLPPGRAILDDVSFKARLFSYLTETSPKRLQLDYDCAAMNLGLYRKFINSLRSRLKPDHLSITALASWIDAPDFDELARSVDELAPMFYDLEADQASEILRQNPRPLVDDSTLSWIKKWHSCPTTWRAGLANFQRLSLFESTGKLIGHLQRWSPNDLYRFKIISGDKNTVIYKIEHSQNYQGIFLKPNNLLIWRSPDESFTARAIDTARASGASGMIWFTHPDSAPIANHSVDHLTELGLGKTPLPKLKETLNHDGSLTLTNHGPGDLPFLPLNSPWQIILESGETGTFGLSDPGTFIDYSAPGGSLVRPEVTRTISLSFSSLRSGRSLRSGQGLILSPEDSPPSIRIQPTPQ